MTVWYGIPSAGRGSGRETWSPSTAARSSTVGTAFMRPRSASRPLSPSTRHCRMRRRPWRPASRPWCPAIGFVAGLEDRLEQRARIVDLTSRFRLAVLVGRRSSKARPRPTRESPRSRGTPAAARGASGATPSPSARFTSAPASTSARTTPVWVAARAEDDRLEQRGPAQPVHVIDVDRRLQQTADHLHVAALGRPDEAVHVEAVQLLTSAPFASVSSSRSRVPPRWSRSGTRSAGSCPGR